MSEDDADADDDVEMTVEGKVAEDPSSFLDSLSDDASGVETDIVSGSEPSRELRELSAAIREADSPPDHRRRAMHAADSPESEVSGFGTDAGLSDEATYETFTLDIDADMAQTLLRHIYSVVEERYQEGYDVDRVVIGMPQYKVLEPWAQAEFGHGIEDVLSSLEVIVVPGPMIHAVIDNKRLLTEEVRE